MNENGLKAVSAGIVVLSGCLLAGMATLRGENAFVIGLIGVIVLGVGVIEWRRVLREK